MVAASFHSVQCAQPGTWASRSAMNIRPHCCPRSSHHVVHGAIEVHSSPSAFLIKDGLIPDNERLEPGMLTRWQGYLHCRSGAGTWLRPTGTRHVQYSRVQEPALHAAVRPSRHGQPAGSVESCTWRRRRGTPDHLLSRSLTLKGSVQRCGQRRNQGISPALGTGEVHTPRW